MADSGQNKTEKATQRKRQKAKRKGDVVESRDLSAGFALFGMSVVFLLFGGEVADGLRRATTDYLAGLAAAPRVATGMAAVATIQHTIATVGSIVGPLLIAIVVIGVAAQVTQHGLVWSPEKLTLNVGKINPFKGFSKIFSLQGVARAVFSVLKLAAIAFVVVLSVSLRWTDIAGMGSLPFGVGIALFFEILLQVLLRVGIAVLVLGIADYAFQRWKKERDMRMTKQEIKEERRQTEGDPHVKGKLRAMALRRAAQRMMADVDTATVVVTNPTHFAVALRYDRGVSAAPTVVAKGLDHLALRIRERAEKANVPIVEKPPLARQLFRDCQIGDEIPAALYRAVAAVLSYVFGLKRGARTR